MFNKYPELERTQRLRFKVACNHFKQQILGPVHVPNQPQTGTLLNALAELNISIAERTWQSWFSSEPPMPQPSKVAWLDKIITKAKAAGLPLYENNYLKEDFYIQLVYGGLLALLLEPSTAHDIEYILQRRVMDYEPMSPLHLHLDAVEASSWYQDIERVEWNLIAYIAADRILQLLGKRWSPRDGDIFKEFALLSKNESSQELNTEKTNKYDLASILTRLHHERALSSGLKPDWHKLGIEVDISYQHIYKLLFSMAADENYLVANRFDAWWLDLATSGLALHALSWPFSERNMGVGHSPENLCFNAIHEIFVTDPSEFEVDFIYIAMAMLNAQWAEGSLDIFLKCRENYRSMLDNIGVNELDMWSGLYNVRSTHSIVFKPIQRGHS